MDKKKDEKTKKDEQKAIDTQIKRINEKIDKLVKEIEKKRKRRCFLLNMHISPFAVEEIFKDLRTQYSDMNGEIDVIANSPGGDLDAAYNLACLFQKYGNKKLTFIVPRWAKSAATLLVCAGEEILMTPIAELGPLDPQITEINPLEERFEQFSPLHIQTTLEMIRNEFEKGNKNLAEGLLKRLQFPLTLGSFVKAHQIAEQYLVRLLKERMEKTEKLGCTPEEIAKKLTKEYADHGFCINITEAKKIGLNVQELEGELLNLVCDLHELLKHKEGLHRKKREADVMEIIEKLPPDILDKIKSKIEEHQQREAQR